MPIKKFQLKQPEKARKIIPEKKHNWNKDFEKREYSKLRSSKRWQRLREAFLYENPICYFGEHIASEVHHIISGREDLFFDKSNLAALCSECHEKVNKAYRRGIKPEILFSKNWKE